MSKSQTIRVALVEIKRIGQSVNGNPRYALTTMDGRTYRTRQDAGDAYKLSPWEAWEDEPYRRYELTLDGRDSVYGVRDLSADVRAAERNLRVLRRDPNADPRELMEAEGELIYARQEADL